MAEYYIDAVNGDDGPEHDGTSEETAWQTIGKANECLVEDDTVILRGGTYRETIRPLNSGLPGQPITYTNYNDEEVIITDVYDAIDLSNKSYIVIDGLTILHTGHYWVNMDPNAHHNIIQNCHMDEAEGWGGIYLRNGADWNQIRNNTLIAHQGPDDPIFCIDSSYNLFEGNNISYGPHCPLNIQSRERATINNVVRNNTIQNTWHHCIAVYTSAHHTLVEGNVLLDAGEDHEDMPPPYYGEDYRQWSRDLPRENHNGLQLGSSNCIIRHNVMINCGSGISMNSYDDGSVARHNRIYHNTLNRNYRGIHTQTDQDTDKNHIKNNIFYENINQEIYRWIVAPAAGDNYYVNNDVDGAPVEVLYNGSNYTIEQAETTHPGEFYDNLSVDPLFVDETNRDLRLSPSSPMIDRASPLTTVTGSGSGTNIAVEDARYFCDGFGVVDADWIKIGSGEPVQIQSVDYETNVIALKAARSWSDGDPVYLYKDSCGKIVLYGEAPDIGAYAYKDVSALAATYYVSTDGSDYNPGTLKCPWKMLEHAFPQLRPGDTLLIRGGTYENDPPITLRSENSGREDAPITVKAYPDEEVIWKGGEDGDLWHVLGQWWVIEDIILEDRLTLGNSASEIAEHITIRNCQFRNSNVGGIRLYYARHTLIDDCYFVNLQPDEPGGDPDAISIEKWGDEITIRDSRFENIGSAGVHVGALGDEVDKVVIENNEFFISGEHGPVDKNGVVVKGVQGPIIISGNKFHGFREGEALVTHETYEGGPAARNVVIEKNLFYDNAIHLWVAGGNRIIVVNNIFRDACTGPGAAMFVNDARNIHILHNTFFNNRYLLRTGHKASTGTVKNNVFCRGGFIMLPEEIWFWDTDDNIWSAPSPKGGMDADYNAWSEIKGGVPNGVKGAHDLDTTDLRLHLDLRPLPCSPLIDAGTDVGVKDDFTGYPRDKYPDIGAYEWRRLWWLWPIWFLMRTMQFLGLDRRRYLRRSGS